MGLLDKLQTNGSTLSTNNGGIVPTIPGGPNGNNLITDNSGLHADAAGNAATQVESSSFAKVPKINSIVKPTF